ncbi:MAG: Ig domain-containing protein [Candidatus Acidiferrales bacterium]
MRSRTADPMECCHNPLELKLRRLAFSALGLALLLAILLSGCGGETGLSVELTPSVNQAVDQNQSVSFTAFVPNDTSNSGVTWTLTGAHCKGAACGTFVNSTPFAATYQAPKSVGNLLTVTLTATSNAENSAYETLNIVVSPAPVISTTTLPGVLNGADYSEQVIANGGVAPLVFSVSSGSLPPGLNLNTNGFVTGRTTSDGGTYKFSLTVTDQGSPPLTATQAYTLVVAPAPALSVATSSLANAAQGTPYSAALAASGGVPPLTWAISSGALPPGLTLTTTTGQISGTPTTQGTFPLTVEVTDSSLLPPPPNHPQTATQSLSLTVGPPNPLSIVTTSLPEADSASLYSQTILETGGVGPFTWTVTNGILPSGMSLESATGTISGIATAVSTNTFTVQVIDSESPPKSASATLTLAVIAAVNNNALLNGDYVFIFSGYDPNGPVVLGGGLVADGAGDVEGTVDSNNNNPLSSTYNNGPGPTQGNALTGTYTLGPDGRGTLTVTVNAIQYTYILALDGNGDAQFIEADTSSNGTRGTGILRKQPTTPNFIAADFSGNYAFQLAGIDSSGKRATYAGVFQADGVGLFQNGNADTNDGGTLGTNIAGVSGAFLVAQNGRGNASISIPNRGTLNFIFYMITPSDVLFMGFDPFNASHPMTTGEAILQTQPSFNAGSMMGSSIVTTTGQDTSGKSSVLLGLLSGNGVSTISAAVNGNDGGSITTTSSSGTYGVAANGRVSTTSIGNQLAVIYLISPNYGFVIGQDSAASSGLAEAQAAGPFTAASFNSYFSFGPPSTGSPVTGDSLTNAFVGSIVSDGVSTISGKIGEVTGADTSNLNLATKGTYTVASNGGGFISFGSPTQLPPQFVFYIVSPTEIRAISAVPSDTQPMVFFFNH